MSEKNGVCAIVPPGQNGFQPTVIGMGILASDREVVTCAHVVLYALGLAPPQQLPAGARVRVCFPFTSGLVCIDGSVDPARWFPPRSAVDGKVSDVAVIQLDADAPAEVGRAILKDHVVRAAVTAYGFRTKEVDGGGRVSHTYGEWARGEIAGPQPGGRAQFDGQHTGASIEKGYSGAGVYDPTQAAVVGMIVQADRDKTLRIAQFIDIQTITKAGVRLALPAVAAPPPAAPLTAPREWYDTTVSLKGTIESDLQEIARALPDVDPADGLKPFLTAILDEDDTRANLLRAAFGLPKPGKRAKTLSDVIGWDEPSTRQLLSALAQRVNQLLWRFVETLKYIQADWAEKAVGRCQRLQAVCHPLLSAHQPTLREVADALKGWKDLRAITESAPDATLYAVLRSIEPKRPAGPADPETDAARSVALDFLYSYLIDYFDGERLPDDSSNLWWSVREGIGGGDARFSNFLPKLVERYDDIRVPSGDVTRLAAVPEIYQPVRTVSYTLSNAQDIVEKNRALDDGLKRRLYLVIHNMLDRLLKTPPSKHLYLASVHHEGLRNYPDYIADQKLPLT